MRHQVEQVLLMGPRKSLVGVITPAHEATRSPDAPFVVILNAGIIHRVGPNRLHVLLARALSELGVGVLRVDLSGLGDSEVRDDGLPPLEAALADIRDILDTLQATRLVQRVVLVGLCSGADHSVIYAGSDPRVVGAVLLDPSIPHTKRYYLNHYISRVLHVRPWLNLLLGRNSVWRSLKRRQSTAAADEQPGEAGPQLTLEHPEVRAFLQDAYARALRNGVQFLAVMTSDRERQHNYRGQLLDAFPQLSFGAQLQLEYFSKCDHTFTMVANRNRLIAQVKLWMKDTMLRADPPA
jgi:pimeloyl-ACP methyl ester carboxylesterase